MPTRKHLVLDEDVYNALLGRKDMTGLPISRVGNAILRSHIAAVSLQDLVGRKLVETGRISHAQYTEALHQASSELRRSFQPARAPVDFVEGGTMVSGSWQIENVFCSSDGSFQILECWARDSLQQPMRQHFHDADEYAIALDGRSLFVMSGLPSTLSKGNVLQVPAQANHSVTPLDRDSHLLMVTVPATPDYCGRLR
jgi:mannose-6-phosphate isomerase-like protein (cupin superfamily)